MKIIKNILCALFSLTILLVASPSVFAQEEIDYERYPYYIENYNIQGDLASNNTMHVTETLDVYYNEPRQGIYRILPLRPQIDAMIDGNMQVMDYKVGIEDLSVSQPFTSYEEDGYLFIRIGQEGQYQTGPVKYTITYVIDFTDDRIQEYDFFYYSVLGVDWDCPIKNFHFAVNFPKVVDLEQMKLYSGAVGSQQDQLNLTWTTSEKFIWGDSTEGIPPETGVTLHTYLPEGYFEGTTKVTAIGAKIGGYMALILFLLILLLWVRSRQSRQVVEVVEFYPPEDMTSAQIGYVMDGFTSDQEAISLVVWLADKGYVEITEKNGKTLLRKTDKPSDDLPTHVAALYDDMFKKVTQVFIENLNLFEGVTAVKQFVPMDFHKNKKLRETAIEVFGVVLAVILILVGTFSLIAFGGDIYYEMALPAIITLFTSVVLLIYGKMCARKWDFLTSGQKTRFKILVLICAVGLSAFSFLVAGSYSFGGVLLPAFVAFSMIVGCSTAGFIQQFTPYMCQIRGRIMGLKRFINDAEKDRLELLVAENPSYFYNILPYAYVFGLSDKWIKKFESIALTAPMAAIPASTLWYTTRALRTAQKSMQPPVDTSQLNSGKSGGFSGGNFSGGFSGGGFGGGGGRSW